MKRRRGTFTFNPTPQMVKPFLDVYANKDSFTQRPIESMGLDRLSKVNRVRANTTDGAKVVSQILNATTGKVSESLVISPIQADYLIQGYLGWVGSMGAATVDVISKTAQGQTMPHKDWFEYQPIKRFYANAGKENYTRYGTEFYKVLRETNKAYADIMHLRKMGEDVAATELLEENRGKLAARKLLSRAQRMLGSISRESKLINVNSRLTAAEKRRRQDVLLMRRNRITKDIVQRIEAMQ